MFTITIKYGVSDDFLKKPGEELTKASDQRPAPRTRQQIRIFPQINKFQMIESTFRHLLTQRLLRRLGQLVGDVSRAKNFSRTTASMRDTCKATLMSDRRRNRQSYSLNLNYCFTIISISRVQRFFS
jgi:hypothetical protein